MYITIFFTKHQNQAFNSKQLNCSVFILWKYDSAIKAMNIDTCNVLQSSPENYAKWKEPVKTHIFIYIRFLKWKTYGNGEHIGVWGQARKKREVSVTLITHCISFNKIDSSSWKSHNSLSNYFKEIPFI